MLLPDLPHIRRRPADRPGFNALTESVRDFGPSHRGYQQRRPKAKGLRCGIRSGSSIYTQKAVRNPWKPSHKASSNASARLTLVIATPPEPLAVQGELDLLLHRYLTFVLRLPISLPGTLEQAELPVRGAPF